MRPERLYYRGHEINSMSIGDAGIEMDDMAWAEFLMEAWPDHRWEPMLGGQFDSNAQRGIYVGRIDPIFTGPLA